MKYKNALQITGIVVLICIGIISFLQAKESREAYDYLTSMGFVAFGIIFLAIKLISSKEKTATKIAGTAIIILILSAIGATVLIMLVISKVGS